MKILIVLAFAALVSGAPRPQDEDDTRIVMGQRSVQMIPYQCSLNRRKSANSMVFSCGCSILDENTILIAAHCLTDNLPGDAYTIGVGATEYWDQTWYTSKSYVNHPLYNTTIKANYDVAIIKLAESIEMVPGKVEAISLPTECPNLPYGEYALASGFGNTAEGVSNEGMVLRQVELQVLRNTDPGCKNYRLSQTMFCAGSDKATGDTCQGDSGGPLAYSNPNNNDQPEVIGIVSTGAGCNRVGFAGIYTDVCSVKQWIEDNQGAQASPNAQQAAPQPQPAAPAIRPKPRPQPQPAAPVRPQVNNQFPSFDDQFPSFDSQFPSFGNQRPSLSQGFPSFSDFPSFDSFPSINQNFPEFPSVSQNFPAFPQINQRPRPLFNWS